MWLFLCFSEVYDQLVGAGLIVPQPEKDPPTVPMDYKWAQELGLVRKPASIMSSISDERGEELLYAGMPISDVFKVCVCACVRVCMHVRACACVRACVCVSYVLWCSNSLLVVLFARVLCNCGQRNSLLRGMGV